MARGGARPRSGRVPDPQALNRQRDGKEWTKLPSAGRLAPAPEWPLAVVEPTQEELLKWRELWTMPQALVWEADRAFDMVAFYVRTYLEAMHPKAGAQARAFVRTVSQDLLLTPEALLRARYVIAGSEEDAAIEAAISRHPAGRGGGLHSGRPTAARDRFTVVGPPVDADEDEDAGAPAVEDE